MGSIDLVIFDCDGVVIDSEHISARMLIAELARRGVEVTPEYVSRNFLGRSYPVVLAQIRGDYGVDLPPEFEVDYRRRLLEAFERDLVEMPGVRKVIGDLAVPYCLATSSSPQRLARSLEICGLSEIFAGLTTTASEVQRGKPAPDLFLLASEKMGVAPERCLVIEDSLNGIRAGLAAGMQVWRFTGGSHLRGIDLSWTSEATPHGQFASYDEFFRMGATLTAGAVGR